MMWNPYGIIWNIYGKVWNLYGIHIKGHGMLWNLCIWNAMESIWNDVESMWNDMESM